MGTNTFQFQTGSIKSLIGHRKIFEGTLKFQFQTGSIKSLNEFWACIMLAAFQFQTGSIKRGFSRQQQ